MRYYMKQKVFSWGDKFRICDENGNEAYHAEGEVFSWGKKLHLYDKNGAECCFIRQKVWSFLARYYISRNGNDIAEVVKKFSFFHPFYTVEPQGWEISGSFLEHDYRIADQMREIASVKKQWFTWGDSYEIDIADGVDAALVLAIVIVIDAVMASESAASAGASSSSGGN